MNVWNKLSNMLNPHSNNQMKNYQEMNNSTMAMNVSILSSYVMNSYRFKNLPEEIDQNLLWAILTQRSTGVMFYNDTIDKFMFLPYTRKDYKGQSNFMFKPSLVEATDFAGKKYHVRTDGTPEENEYLGVILNISNTSRFNTDLHYTLAFYAQKMTEIDRSIDVRRNYHRAPAIFSGDEKLRSSFVRLFQDITEFKPFFVVSDTFADQFNTMNIDFNYISDKLYNEKRQYQNEFLNLWGINNNSAEDKKERMITDEVNANNEQLLINRDNVLNSLNAFSKEFNEKFGYMFEYEVKAYFKRATVEEEKPKGLDEIFTDEGGDDDEVDV